MKYVVMAMVFILLLQGGPVRASEYLTYQSIEVEGEGKLLSDYTPREYQELHDALSRRKFWGWRTLTHVEDAPVRFQKETLYEIVNEGETAIQQNFSFIMKEQRTTQVSASGNIGLSMKGDVRGFQSGLDSHVKPSVTHTRDSSIEETVDIRIMVDPGTSLHIGVYGEGYVSSGVGRQYRFFRNVRSGGWEVFTLTTEYYSIDKEALT